MRNLLLLSLLFTSVVGLSSCWNSNSTWVEKEIWMNESQFQLNNTLWKEILVDSNLMTLYTFKNDSEGVSNCSWDCEVKWPVFYSETLNTWDYSSIKREDGKMQTTYKWSPLYYFFKDKAVWDVNGDKVKDVWFVVTK